MNVKNKKNEKTGYLKFWKPAKLHFSSKPLCRWIKRVATKQEFSKLLKSNEAKSSVPLKLSSSQNTAKNGKKF